MAMYDTAPKHSNTWSAPLPPEGFVPDLQMDDSFQSVGSLSAVSECRIAVSPPMLQKSTNSWKLLPIPPMEPDSQGKTTQYSEAKQVKTLINYHHASAHRDTMQVWLPEMGLPPPGALRMQSSGHSPHGRDAAPMAHGHSMSAVVWLLKRSFSALGATQPAKVLLRTLAYRRQRKQQRKGCARMPPPGCPAHGHRWGARC
jgi:hypothetical protein